MNINLTSFQMIGGIIAFLLGFLCRLGLLFENKKTNSGTIIFTFIFSASAGFIIFIFALDKNYSNFFTLTVISLASFFGSEIIPGLGAIKGKFFRDIFKDIIRKWAGVKINEDDYETRITNEEIPTDYEMSKDKKDPEDMGQ